MYQQNFGPIDNRTPEELTIEQLRRDNDTLRQEVAQLSQFRMLAYRDPLTGLRNRRYCSERLTEELDRAQRQKSARFSVLIIDLDDFKKINDEHGHHAGDQALQWFARWLETGVRHHDAACRTGGDEFTVILPNATEIGRHVVINRLREVIDEAAKTSALPFPVRFSIGGATFPASGVTVERLQREADAAMYRDKVRQKKAAKAIARIAGVG